ncbi:MAG: NUDIX domain-containing protein [bacterium]
MPLPEISKRKYMFTDDIKFLQKIIIFHPEEYKFLALKRSKNMETRPSCYDLPGGNVLFGELHMDSLKKEIKEETGIEAEDIKIAYFITNYENGIYYIFAGYTGNALSENIKLSHEHSEYRWVTKEEFLKLESGEYLINFINATLK